MGNCISHSLCLATSLFIATIACGCVTSATSLATSEASLDAGLRAFEEKDWATAETNLSAAVVNGHLQPDLTEIALRSLAVARIHLDKLTAAESDLMVLSQNAADMDLYWLACAELALKKGDLEAARDAANQAREFNPGVELPSELK